MSTVPRLEAGRDLPVAADRDQVDAGEGAAGLDAGDQLDRGVDAGVAVVGSTASTSDGRDRRSRASSPAGAGPWPREASTITPA